MPRKLLLAVTFAIAGIFLTAEFSVAAAKKKRVEKPDPALAAVETVLRTEVAGEVDRRRQLAETIEQQPDSPAARWQSGFVRDGNAWQSFDEPSPANAELLEQYRFRRADAPNTFPGQLDLANWCKKQGLADQERVHLSAALSLSPDQEQPAVLQRLGFREISGIWLSRENLRDWKALNQRAEASLKRWESKLNTIATGLAGSSRQHDAALAKLRELTDPSAIPAIELTLAGHSEEAASAAVELFKRIADPEASLALAKQGVFSKWPAVRQSAATALKTRHIEEFAPPLICLLATATRSEFRVTYRSPIQQFGAPTVVLLYSYVLARETGDQFQVATIETSSYLINEAVNGSVTSGEVYRRNRGNNALDWGLMRGHNDAFRFAAGQTDARNRIAAEFNDWTNELNGRIGQVLSAVSGEPQTSDPDVWWKWWRTFSDTQQSGSKPVVVVDEKEVVGNPLSRYYILSCFAAGTPVWTEQGSVPIERIKAGDRVLSKDVETGELSYKPVLQTTIRPPKELTTLRFGNETIVCTGGHRFWSSGSGWIKARDLAPQTLLHTVTGNTPVWSAKKGDSAQTYNLVVADFHTYFVGKQGILCQDLLIPRGTHSVVPGLSRSSAVAQTKK